MLIKREVLKSVLPATEKDDSRYFLHAVNVKPNGEVQATNGHVAIVAKDRHPFDDTDFPAIPGREPFHGSPEKPVLLPVDLVQSMIAAMPKRTPISVLTSMQLAANGSDDSATVAVTDLQAPRVATVVKDGQQFPDIDRVIPSAEKPETVPVYLAVDVLEVICKAARAAAGSAKTKVIVRFDIPTDRGSRRKIGARATDDQQTTDIREVSEVETAIRATVTTDDVELVIAAMPCRS